MKVIPDLPLDPLELDLHRLAELEVERAQRLVQQEGTGIVHQGAGQGHPLLLPAAQLRRLSLGQESEPDDLRAAP